MGGACSTSREMKISWKILARKPEGKSYLEDLNVDGRIILKCILMKQDTRL
jgi:hypothetical protein